MRGAAFVLSSQRVIRGPRAKRLLASPSQKCVALACDWGHDEAIKWQWRVIQMKEPAKTSRALTSQDLSGLLSRAPQRDFRGARFDERGGARHRHFRFVEITQTLEEMRHALIDFDVDIDVGGRRPLTQPARVVL